VSKCNDTEKNIEISVAVVDKNASSKKENKVEKYRDL